MIRFFMLQNRAGKTRLSKWYDPFSEEEKEKIKADVYRVVTSREKGHTNFVEWRTFKIIYRRYAGLYFILCCDVTDNELAYFEAIHLLVEVLDQFFGNVCELDLVFNFHKVYMVVDEIFLGGELCETSKPIIREHLRRLEEME